MSQLISKTRFLDYLKCPGWCWLYLHNRPLAEDWQQRSDAFDHRTRAGIELESYAYRLFPEITMVASGDDSRQDFPELARQTRELMADPGLQTIGQAVFVSSSNLLVVSDVIRRDPQNNQNWWLYEIKSTSQVEAKKHIPDLAFQKLVLNHCGLNVSKTRILHLNKTYLRSTGVIEPELLFCHDDQDYGVDVSPAVDDYLKGLSDQQPTPQPLEEVVSQAVIDLGQAEPLSCNCQLKTRTNQCPTAGHFHPEIMPEDTIYHLRRLLPGQLEQLLKAGILKMADIPEEIQAELSNFQQNQIQIGLNGQLVQQVEINKELQKLTAPVYFFDYETFSEAVPVIAGSGPYWQLPFLYALQRLADPGQAGEAELLDDYLVESMTLPELERLVDNLKRVLGPVGSVIVWNASFERMVNNNLVKIFPGEADFFNNLNDRLYDLEKIFSGGLYMDGRFAGKTSVKKITSVWLPDLDYQHSDLKIKKGDQATREWLLALDPATRADQRLEIFNNLKKYCRQDTLVMVKILQRLWRG